MLKEYFPRQFPWVLRNTVLPNVEACFFCKQMPVDDSDCKLLARKHNQTTAWCLTKSYIKFDKNVLTWLVSVTTTERLSLPYFCKRKTSYAWANTGNRWLIATMLLLWKPFIVCPSRLHIQTESPHIQNFRGYLTCLSSTSLFSTGLVNTWQKRAMHFLAT